MVLLSARAAATHLMGSSYSSKCSTRSVSTCKSSAGAPRALRLPTRSNSSSAFHGAALPCAHRNSSRQYHYYHCKRRSTNIGNSFGAAPARSTTSAFLGVGTPEVLVIGVVSLIVFGPKGLAEAARTLGQTLKAFQPTIRELQDVSNEFKSTLESEIGIDELRDTVRSTTRPPPRSPTTPPPSTGSGTGASFLEQESTTGMPADVVTPEMIEASKAAAWGGAAPESAEVAPEAVAAAEATIKELSEKSNVVLNIPPELQAETPSPSAESTPESAAPQPSDTPKKSPEEGTPPSAPPSA